MDKNLPNGEKGKFLLCSKNQFVVRELDSGCLIIW